MSDERTELAAAVERLEAITARLAGEDLDATALGGLADEAMAISARVNELLPRVIRAIERASEGSTDPD